MLPLQLAGLALAGRSIIMKYGSPFTGKGKTQFTLNRRKQMKFRGIQMKNPFQNIFKGLTSTVRQLAKTAIGEDYSSIVRGFLPSGAKLITPENPPNSKEYKLADLDGDSAKELFVSFRSIDGISTVVLKKKSERWNRVAEFNIPQYEKINFRSTADITGSGIKCLLLGLSSKDRIPMLYAYSLEGGEAKEIFSQSYHKVEVISPADKRTSAGKQLAIWKKNDTGSYDIELLRWNGMQLEQQSDVASYYSSNVIPYYARKVKRNPYAASSWYNLACALEKAGEIRDEELAIEIGIAQDKSGVFSEKFNALNNNLKGIKA